MDWSKHAKKKSKPTIDRRLSLPITVDLQRVIDFFKNKNPDLEFSDTAVLMTFIEAGMRSYIAEINASKKAATVTATDEEDDE